MSERLVVGNWKMNMNLHQASLLVNHLDKKVSPSKGVTVVLCPPFIDLAPLAREIDKKKFKLGAQNINDAEDGAYTGEISASMLKGLAEYVIIGHSERRRYFGEDDHFIARKLASAVRYDLVPILCVGESLHDREAGLSKRVVVSQLEAGLSQLSAEDVSTMAIAYEPVWAIGTGQVATPEQISPVVDAIRNTVEEIFGESAGMSMRLLYGGSVEPDNSKLILGIDGIDGFLVGGASINFEKFAKIIDAAQEKSKSK